MSCFTRCTVKLTKHAEISLSDWVQIHISLESKFPNYIYFMHVTDCKSQQTH